MFSYRLLIKLQFWNIVSLLFRNYLTLPLKKHDSAQLQTSMQQIYCIELDKGKSYQVLH